MAISKNRTCGGISSINKVAGLSGYILDSDPVSSCPGVSCCERVLTSLCLQVNVKAPAITSVAVLAKISLRSPQKMSIFIIKKSIYRVKESKNNLI